MILQPRADQTLRVIRQHDHALLCGECAAHWRGPGANAQDQPSAAAILAIAMHDMGWRETDAMHADLPWNAEAGQPYDFQSMPTELRARIYTQGIDDAAALHPHAGLLTSRHYRSFVPRDAAPDFHANEEARRRKLQTHALVQGEIANFEADYALLRYLDLLSLYVCMTTPGSDSSFWPGWLGGSPARHTLPAREGDVPAHVAWRDEQTLTVEPFPFRSEVRFVLPCRDLPRASFADREEFLEAWRAQPERTEEVRIVAG